MELETRSLPGMEIRSVDTDRHEFEARILTYNRADTFGTVWKPGVFNDSLAKKLPPILWEHQRGRVIGRATEFEDTPSGLNVRARLANPEHVPDAAMVHSLFEDGLVDQFSVGFARTKMTTIPPSQRSAFGELPAREMAHKGYLGEISVVTAGSVPDTTLLALRSDDATEGEERTVDLPTVEEILELRNAKVISKETAEAMLFASKPAWREHIRIAPEPDGTRDDDTGLDDEDAATLAAATDSALDEAMGLLGSPDDWAGLPENVQRALPLVAAAGEAVDGLLEAMGIEDVDDTGTEERADDTDGERAAGWNPKQGDYTPAQWKEACLVDTGSGEPDDKDRYKLPVKTPDGKVDEGGLDSANKMFGNVKGASDEAMASGAKNLMSMLGKTDMKPSPSVLNAAKGGSRADAEPADLDDLFAKHGL